MVGLSYPPAVIEALKVIPKKKTLQRTWYPVKSTVKFVVRKIRGFNLQISQSFLTFYFYYLSLMCSDSVSIVLAFLLLSFY